jgi:hypothetical protein
MRRPLFAFALASCALVLAAGCGNNYPVVPEPTPTPACEVGPSYTVCGSGTVSQTFTVGVTPAAVVLPPGGQMQAEITIQYPVPPSASGTLLFSSAIAAGITPSPGVDDVNPAATPFLYYSTYNPGSTTLEFLETATTGGDPTVTVSNITGKALQFFKTTTGCELDQQNNAGQWVAARPLVTWTTPPASFTFPSLGDLQFNAPAGSQGLHAIACTTQ